VRSCFTSFAVVGCAALLAGCSGSSSNAPAPNKDPIKSVTDGAKDLAKDAKDKITEGAKDVAKDAKDKIEAGKAELAKLSDLATKEFPAIQTKINGLSGDAKTKATDAFEALKKLIEDAKTSVGDSAKWKTAWDAIVMKLADLKKQVGL
jgi:hypothetical protein